MKSSAAIAALQPCEAMIADKKKKEAELAEARAKAPVAKPGTKYPLKDNTAKNRPATVPTTFTVTWELNALVLDITCHEPHMDKLNISDEVHNGDCVAISIETPLHSYYHIEINPDSGIFQGNTAGDWKSLTEVKSKRGADSWQVRVRRPIVGNIEAMSDPKHGIAAWICPKPNCTPFSPTKSGWHVPEKFGRLVAE